MQLTFLGATGTVTGSKYLVTVGDKKILVDCGLFQGYKQLRLRNWAPLPVAPNDVDAVVLTHAHLDHTGYLPLLVKNGFRGSVFCSEATRDLCAILLPDSGHLQEEEANYANRRGFSKHKPALPLYTIADAENSLARLTPLAFDRETALPGGVTLRRWRIGSVVTMNIKRITKHLLLTHWQVNRAFPRQTLTAIEHAIKAGETAHVGEIRFAVEGALHTTPLFKGQSARERALEVFSQLRVWDTEHNNGVLIYLLLADRDVEIVADRGIHSKVGSREWENICRTMEAAFKQANYEGGVVSGIQAVTQHLMKHFPASDAGRNELPDRPVVL